MCTTVHGNTEDIQDSETSLYCIMMMDTFVGTIEFTIPRVNPNVMYGF